ncbi:MAG: hypothetical protein ABIN36_16670 [Ferruginibacter sp.]
MKKMIFSLLFLIAIGGTSYAQCNQRVTFNATKTDYLDGSGSVQQSKTENTLVNFDNEQVSILSNGEQMSGTVLSSNCDWKKSYSEGKTILKANVTGNQGNARAATITMEGKDGNVSMLIEVDNMPSRKLQLSSDSFREQQ